MVDIIKQRQSERAANISRICDWIKKGNKQKDKRTSYKFLVIFVRDNLNLSDRTAKEYIETALFRLKKTKQDLNK